MVWQRKVVWAEGMFLRPQHFQQQDRFTDFLVQARTLPTQFFFWGFSSLVLDTELLALGKIGLISAEGVLPDGTPFSFPHHDEPPPALSIGKDVKDTVIHLALPMRRRMAAEVSLGSEPSALVRYAAEVIEVADSNDVGAQAAEVQVGQIKLALRASQDIADGWVSLPLVQVVERRADGSLLLDPTFIPTVVTNADMSNLSVFCRELFGLLRQRGAALEERLTQPGRGGVGEVGDFLMLQFLNRWEPAVEHWVRIRAIHPERLFDDLLKMAGELATFTRDQRRPAPMPAYDHDDLRSSFLPLMLELRRGLSSVLEQNAIQIELQERQYGVHVALIPSTELLTSCDFVLAVHSQATVEFLRAHFPTQIKLGPVERIRDLVNLHLPGVTLRSLPVAPREIPYHAGYSYFELDTAHDLWRQLQNSGGLALHVSGEFPELQLEMWAIRR
ncbi:type VI secretion system baseplate subunit TssK [Acidovorax sp. SUPP3434]|uniref:type VI secretion system baseplate subunit TssK n=1 Tax=Acidovorax sp. SUPP3434 TaxID=2920880 RepID=UPI0023DE55C5|nr:type VI secretion system baseplate subunit TssK [Acidovorax sp. SUPP3434]GKT00529.1 type VI secretion system baseplate subunit TssK [Acidovorax sp. SUPP3434]